MPAKKSSKPAAALPPISKVRPRVVDPKLTPPVANPFRGQPNLIQYAVTDYPNRPLHRGHTLEVHAWNDEVGLLVVRSDDRTNECLVTPAELRRLADALERDLPNNR